MNVVVLKLSLEYYFGEVEEGEETQEEVNQKDLPTPSTDFTST